MEGEVQRSVYIVTSENLVNKKQLHLSLFDRILTSRKFKAGGGLFIMLELDSAWLSSPWKYQARINLGPSKLDPILTQLELDLRIRMTHICYIFDVGFILFENRN